MLAKGFVLLLGCLISASFSMAGETNPLVSVKAGKLSPFWRKNKKENQKVRPISVGKLIVQTHQVTNDEFLKFLIQNSKWQKSQIPMLFSDSNYLAHFKNDLELKEGFEMNAPVTNVSWFAAKSFCESLGLRLPTIIEWEYLAAADEKRDFAYGDKKFLGRILEWYGSTQERLKPVQSVYRNKYGLYDFHGLVWEWVEDFNSNFVTGESREDSSLNRDLFCGAGGMAAGDKENYAAYMRFAFRSSLNGNSAIWNLGFRCLKRGDQ